MGKYGKAAIAATALVAQGRTSDASKAWEISVSQQFPTQTASQRKGCPRAAYLGLCEAGLIKGVPPGTYTRSHLNKRYAIEAVRRLQEEPSLASEPETLWLRIMEGDKKVQNSQMDIVIALWERGLIHETS